MKLSASQFAQFLLVAVCGIGVAHAADPAPCSNATLRGDYAFTITGQVLTPAPAAGPTAGVALSHFDGKGEMHQVDHVVHDGVPPVEDWRPGSGWYEVNSDCTGSFAITQMPTDPADGSPLLKLYFVVANDGHEIRTVVSRAPEVAAFSAAIVSIGTRVRDCPPE